jgi:NAD(P)-dependent dehydrogenase (short-subunit alcohol dehydrogenase family)
MLKRGSGAIVNVASGRGLQGAAGGSHYAASKAGLLSLTRSLALEWGPSIRVNAVVPGVTDTDQPREASPNEEELYSRGRKIPLGRIGQPEDIANAVCFLLSSDASYVTGQSLCVNGGSIMH